MRKKRKRQDDHCIDCGALREYDEFFSSGRCRSCRATRGSQHRMKMGAKLLARGEETGTEVRDGQTFKVVTLPPKRRGGWTR